jgi:hypothetical protein
MDVSTRCELGYGGQLEAAGDQLRGPLVEPRTTRDTGSVTIAASCSLDSIPWSPMVRRPAYGRRSGVHLATDCNASGVTGHAVESFAGAAGALLPAAAAVHTTARKLRYARSSDPAFGEREPPVIHAAVLTALGTAPTYGEFDAPVGVDGHGCAGRRCQST